MLLADEEIETRLRELQKIKLDLDVDPIKNGLSGVNAKIAEAQQRKDLVNSLLIEAIQNKAEAQIMLDTRKGEHSRSLETLLLTDPEVQGQKTEKLRLAAANVKMPELVLQVFHAERDYARSDAYYKCVHQMYTNLDSVNSNISRQISVIQMGLQIGEINREEFSNLFGKKIKVR